MNCGQQGSGQTLDSGGQSWHEKRHFYSTAMFLYSKYSVFHVFSNCCGGWRIRVLGAAAQRRPLWAQAWDRVS